MRYRLLPLSAMVVAPESGALITNAIAVARRLVFQCRCFLLLFAGRSSSFTIVKLIVRQPLVEQKTPSAIHRQSIGMRACAFDGIAGWRGECGVRVGESNQGRKQRLQAYAGGQQPFGSH